MEYQFNAVINVEETIEAENREQALKIFRERQPKAEIITLNDKTVLGTCENTGLPIVEGDAYNSDSEGIMWLKEKYLKEILLMDLNLIQEAQ
jgi:hypothetical protein